MGTESLDLQDYISLHILQQDHTWYKQPDNTIVYNSDAFGCPPRVFPSYDPPPPLAPAPPEDEL